MGKVGRPTNKELAKRKIEEPALAARMYEMLIAGHSIGKIAVAFDCGVNRVHAILERNARKELMPYVEEYRDLQLSRLDYLWQKLVESGRLEKGDPAAINAGVSIQARLSKALGLDAPTQLEMQLVIDPREIELRPLILAARKKAIDEARAIRGELASAEDESEDDEDDDE